MQRTNFLKNKIYNIIFTTNGRHAYLFDVWLLVFILLSCLVVVLESVPAIVIKHGRLLSILEWFFTIIFTIEYVLRIYSSKNTWKYIFSWWGLIDLLAVLPSYIGILVPGDISALKDVRILRLIRVFRVFKLKKYMTGGNIMMIALDKSRPKILTFVLFILLSAVVLGSVMYVIEASHNENINSIPDAIYWAIVTLTTVGYGDIQPVTAAGRVIASFIMILGYGIIAVPTGIVSAEITKEHNNKD